MHPIALHYCVAILLLAERHLVMQTGTAAFGNLYSQALLRIFPSLRQQTLELSNSVVRDTNHQNKKYGGEVAKSKDRDGELRLLLKEGRPPPAQTQMYRCPHPR